MGLRVKGNCYDGRVGCRGRGAAHLDSFLVFQVCVWLKHDVSEWLQM